MTELFHLPLYGLNDKITTGSVSLGFLDMQEKVGRSLAGMLSLLKGIPLIIQRDSTGFIALKMNV